MLTAPCVSMRFSKSYVFAVPPDEIVLPFASMVGLGGQPLADALKLRPMFTQDARSIAVFLPQHPQQKVLGPDALAPQQRCFLIRVIEYPLAFLRKWQVFLRGRAPFA